MRVLGISSLDRDATASLYLDGTWHAIAEERLSRQKLHAGFPHRALAELLQRTGAQPADIDHVAYPFLPWWREAACIMGGYLREFPAAFLDRAPWHATGYHLGSYAKWCLEAVLSHRKYHRELAAALDLWGIRPRLIRIEHHLAHTAGAYLTSGFENALALTLDWYGSGLSGSVSRCTPDHIQRLKSFRYPHSLGLFFAQVTQALGFKPSRHEGKVVGLAAFGDHRILGDFVLDRFEMTDGRFRYRTAMNGRFARDLAARFPREHVAAAYQHALERIVCSLVEYWRRETGLHDVVLSGGVMANVKLNQRIAELCKDLRVFIHPAMGDGGTSVGATLALLFEKGEIRTRAWKTCHLGPAYTETELADALASADVNATRLADWPKAVARLLTEGKVVARFGGAMEYGPRALGNRSILCAAIDPAVNDCLNRRLQRTEFMPFAPATLEGFHIARYYDIEKVDLVARFMTVTVPCTALMKKESPAAVHIDGTARPQIVRQKDNPDLFAILEAYHRRTGIPTLINTSFNIHEEPIVCTPADAIRVFRQGRLDALSMGPFLALSV